MFQIAQYVKILANFSFEKLESKMIEKRDGGGIYNA